MSVGCGIDLGSRSVKLAVLDNNKIIELKKFDTIQFYRDFGRRVEGQLVIDWAGLGVVEADYVVSTGYGRNALDLAGAKIMPEIKAHVVGAVYQTGLKNFTLLDLGGQDSKIVKVVEGRAADFLTNDKCAASSGRYLENMAHVLGMSLGELGRYWQDPVELNSTCAVFGESEIIGKIVDGNPMPNLAAGVNYTIFKRIQPMLRKLMSPVLVFTGGVAHNRALREIICAASAVELVIPEHPQFNGAIGCAVSGAKG
ncbi:MAG: acyl-CoA dehydratase activase [Peptococcaceae bacterium]|nr:acyl-CoA dehydratase activase [Peptococcaceae bacterium]